MVNPKLYRSMLPLLALLATPLPARADGILEQLQKEVSAIATRTKSAVVTIEDENVKARVGETLNSLRVDALTSTKVEGAEFDILKKQLEEATQRRDKLQADLDEKLQIYGENHPTVKAEKATLAQAKKRLDTLQQELKKSPSVVKYRVMILPQSGSGFSIGEGYILTTADVLTGMKNPLVITDDGTRIKALILGVNNDLNIGLVKLQAKIDLPALKLGDSANVAVGHFAISVGNQGGQANSVALMLVGGIRSDGLSAGNHFYPNLIQIAGTVGAGISGAPLVDAKGEVIGIMAGVPAVQTMVRNLRQSNFFAPSDLNWNAPDNSSLRLFYQAPDADKANPYVVPPKQTPGEHLDTAPQVKPGNDNSVPLLGDLPLIGKLFQSNGNVNVTNDDIYTASPVTSAGFAVPINDIKPILEELKTGKPVTRGWIGVSPKDEVTTIEKGGIITINRIVTIEGVYPDSPAFRAGVEPGDIVLRVNKKPIRSATEVREASQRLRPGETVTIVVRRSGMEQTLTLRIEGRPETFKPPITAPVKEKE